MTRGTLTNNETGQALTGELAPYGFSFRIDGCGEFNAFRPGEWAFTPDLEPLPTEDGYYVSDSSDYLLALFQLYGGVWEAVRTGKIRTKEEMRERLPLVRLVREDGK